MLFKKFFFLKESKQMLTLPKIFYSIIATVIIGYSIHESKKGKKRKLKLKTIQRKRELIVIENESRKWNTISNHSFML